jgi:glycine betaine/proline transport system substrate-binding protein
MSFKNLISRRSIGKSVAFATAALTASTLAGGRVAVAEEKRKIKAGVLQWEDTTATSRVTTDLLKRFGYEIEEKALQEWGIAFAALVKGDTDIMVSQVDYVTHDYWTKNVNKLEKVSVVSYGLYQGIVVPDYVTISSIEELNANKDKFGGKIIGIEPGSGLMRQSRDLVKVYGLDLELIDGSTPAMTAALKSAIDKKEWIAVTLWRPSWMALRFPVKFLEDPKNVQEPNQAYHWIARKGFAEEFPNARQIMASVFLPIEGVGQITTWENDGLSLDDAIVRWEKENKDRIDRWATLGIKPKG